LVIKSPRNRSVPIIGGNPTQFIVLRGEKLSFLEELGIFWCEKTYSGWWFQPSRKILVIPYIMEHKKCLKPPTSTSNLPIPEKWLMLWLMLHPLMANQTKLRQKKNRGKFEFVIPSEVDLPPMDCQTISGWWFQPNPSEK